VLFAGSLLICNLGAECKTRQASVTPTIDVGVKFISREKIAQRAVNEKKEEVIIMFFISS